jgi:hypothetical protein
MYWIVPLFFGFIFRNPRFTSSELLIRLETSLLKYVLRHFGMIFHRVKWIKRVLWSITNKLNIPMIKRVFYASELIRHFQFSFIVLFVLVTYSPYLIEIITVQLIFMNFCWPLQRVPRVISIVILIMFLKCKNISSHFFSRSFDFIQVWYFWWWTNGSFRISDFSLRFGMICF